MTLTRIPDGREIKTKIKAKKKDKYGYLETYLFGLTAEGVVLYRTDHMGKYRMKGSISEPENRTKEWFSAWLVKNGYEILEEEVKNKSEEPILSHYEMGQLLRKAQEAGFAAGVKASPTPMRVVQHVNPLDDNSPISVDWGTYSEGVCGFAWIHFVRANTRFVNFLKKMSIGHKAYGGGWDIWVNDFGQSMERKQAYARAFSGVLTEVGIDTYAQSRMD